ncbi:hypothetical protein KR018_008313 [Drosophila ironensis]|nr:hypothetical protein KR018_008313 [Drosophila ironensis]
MPRKTKAEQKMFTDSAPISPQPGGEPGQPGQPSHSRNRKLSVRLHRLTPQEINSACTALSTSTFAAKPRRGRPPKNRDNQTSKPAAPKKETPKGKGKGKVHIKVPLQQNGAKKRSIHRDQTPPPSRLPRLSSPAPKPKKKDQYRGLNATRELVEQFSPRYFNCYVNMKRTPMPLPNCIVSGSRQGRPRRPHLTVSFSETVVVIGGENRSTHGSRRATYGSSSSSPRAPKPTRLQRVDDKGNVLEDIALTSTSLLSGSAGALKRSPPSRGRPPSLGQTTSSQRLPATPPSGSRKRRSCNGTPKRPQRQLLSGLASLRLDDGPEPGDEEEDADAEYIVPNELPNMLATPPAKKKRVTTTTTISDDEEEKSPTATAATAAAAAAAAAAAHKEAKREAKAARKKDKNLKKHKDTKGTHTHRSVTADKAESKPKDSPKKSLKVAETVLEKQEEPKIAEAASKPEDKSPETEKEAAETSKIEAGEEPEKKVEIGSTPKIAEESLQTEAAVVAKTAAKEDAAKPEVTAERKEVQATPLPSEDHEDVLDIQTSLDDVRQLHTPVSSHSSSTPATKNEEEEEQQQQQQDQRQRFDSIDSECSFISVSDNRDKLLQELEELRELQKSDLEEQEEIDRLEALAVAQTEPSTEPSTAIIPSDLIAAPLPAPAGSSQANGGDDSSAMAMTSAAIPSSIPSQYYSTIEPMPSLDDEVLCQLAGEFSKLSISLQHHIDCFLFLSFLLPEPDFHTISSGTLDDIMTALDS